MVVKKIQITQTVKRESNYFLEFLDGKQFDMILEKITKMMFWIIIALGLSYFLF